MSNCKKCSTPLEVRQNMFYWRGQYFTGLVCASCNALWDNPEDSFMERVTNLSPEKQADRIIKEFNSHMDDNFNTPMAIKTIEKGAALISKNIREKPQIEKLKRVSIQFQKDQTYENALKFYELLQELPFLLKEEIAFVKMFASIHYQFKKAWRPNETRSGKTTCD